MTRADLIPLMTMLVAAAAAVSTYLQWRKDKRGELTKNAIDFSKYFYERTDEATKSAVMKGYASQPMSTEEMKLFAAILDQLEYLALLTNKGKLDQSFLSPDVQCLMVFALGAYNNLKKSLPQIGAVGFPELSKFVPRANCPSKAAFDAMAASLRRT
jgi:hypothetical protein